MTVKHFLICSDNLWLQKPLVTTKYYKLITNNRTQFKGRTSTTVLVEIFEQPDLCQTDIGIQTKTNINQPTNSNLWQI